MHKQCARDMHRVCPGLEWDFDRRSPAGCSCTCHNPYLSVTTIKDMTVAEVAAMLRQPCDSDYVVTVRYCRDETEVGDLIEGHIAAVYGDQVGSLISGDREVSFDPERGWGGRQTFYLIRKENTE